MKIVYEGDIREKRELSMMGRELAIGDFKYELMNAQIQDGNSYWHFANKERKISLIIADYGTGGEAHWIRVLKQIKPLYATFLFSSVLNQETNTTVYVHQTPFDVAGYIIIYGDYLNADDTIAYIDEHSDPQLSSHKYQLFVGGEHRILEIEQSKFGVWRF